ncbi:AMP-binding protein [Skermanella rosea]|uniref:phenylacetate--CoA ligase family protein n=1 Tax=Skermanella rosea TaxID=1817965 RepID=UPI00193120BB|nr:AMP-binding protein [Skermanella rosea]UEM04358.1 AMP-binding protein [Skermanella rosea]
MANNFYDDLETRSADEREASLLAALPEQIHLAQRRAPAYGRILRGIDAMAVTTWESLAALPVTRKSDLTDLQGREPPFGGFSAVAPGELARIFASPGPIFDPEARRTDYWRFARALFATGFRAGDVLHNCFSYHFTPAGSMFESGAHALGCAVFPAGTGNTELQVQAIAGVRPAGYAGTPDYLKVILEKADEQGVDLSFLRLGHVTGGAFMPDVKRFYRDRGLEVFQSYGTADLGLVAYETAARDGLVLDEHVIVEIVRPGTGDPVSEGEVGEIVVTVLNRDYPLVRFATGDLSAFMPGTSPCGRTNRRIRGWMGRADQTTKVKGMFVHAGQVAEVLKRHPECRRGRLVVDRAEGTDIMTLKVEAPSDADAGALAASLAAVTKLKGAVEIVAPGSLPNDGKMIDDLRKYEG